MVTSDAVVTGGAMSAGYPPEWEFDGLLRNGEAVVVRPIQPGDAPALVGLRANVPPGTHQHELLASPISAWPRQRASARWTTTPGWPSSRSCRTSWSGWRATTAPTRGYRRPRPASSSPAPAGATVSRPCCSRAWRSTRGPRGSCASPPRSGRRTRPCLSYLPRRACTAPGTTARRRCASRSTCGRRRPTVRRVTSGRRWRRSLASRRSFALALSPSSEQDGTRATSGIRWSSPCSPATSPERSTRLIPPPGRLAACPRSRRCCRYPSRSTWLWSPFPPRLSPP